MLIKGMKIIESNRKPVTDMVIPFDTLEVGDAWKVDLGRSSSKSAYNLLRVRVHRACSFSRTFVTRKQGGDVFVFRTA